MDSIAFRVCNMRKEDVPQVVDIYKKERWNRSERSYYNWLEVDPEAFKIALTDSEEVLGVCCAMRIHENFYFIGCYIVKKEYRGLGIGRKVWNACMEHIGQSNAGLNCPLDSMEFYKNTAGFSVIDELWSISGYSTTEDIIHPENLSNVVPEGVSILPFNESLLHIMFEYDFKISGYDRNLALKLNCNEEDSKTLVAVKDGVCIGYGTVKRSVLNIPMIGPLYANDTPVAETILRRLLLSYPFKKGLLIRTFSCNHAANQLIRKIGCPFKFKLVRLYKSKTVFANSTQKVFAISNTTFTTL